MRSCSDSIAQLASPLAKAQIELVNPVKTLTGVIDRWGSGNEGQSYRYAPLSAGLEIVRSTLCKHELAVIQTTHFDQESGVVMLTTTLAHGSGEWVSAFWPVCRTADMANPKLMGAALTYARRYGLFTLVGIAGEDDLDAPDLRVEPGPARGRGEHKANGGAEAAEIHTASERLPLADAPESPSDAPGEGTEREAGSARPRKKRRDAGVPRGPRTATGSVESAVQELAACESAEALFEWAVAALPFRNGLTESQRDLVDSAFFARADALGADPDLFIALEPPAPERPNGATLTTAQA